MTIWIIGIVAVILVWLGAYYLINKASKYKGLWLGVVGEMAVRERHYKDELYYRNKVQKRLEERDELLRKVCDGSLSVDALNLIRSGMLPASKEGLN